MKRKRNPIKCKIGILFATVLLLVSGLTLKAEAGFGDFNDYDSGGWDSGSDWGSDWDSDYDWDDGWSSTGTYSYSSSSGSIDGVEQIMYMFLLITVVVIRVVLRAYKSSNRTTSTGTRRTTSMPVRTQTKILPDRTNEISKIIQENDPCFTAPDFISFAKQVYVDIQDAWCKRDLEPVRGVLHQNLYQQTQRQIERKIADGIVNYLERISVNTAYLTSYRRDAQYEYVSIYLAASMIDYQVKEATGEVILGDMTTRWNLKYKMTFMRTNGSTSRSAEEKDKGFVCPNCGAPLTGTSFGKCEYCDSVVTTGVYDWVLSGFGVVKEDTIDDGIVR